jgi:hypothetical protein
MVNLDACWENRRMVEDGISTRYFTLNSTLVIEFYLHTFSHVLCFLIPDYIRSYGQMSECQQNCSQTIQNALVLR